MPMKLDPKKMIEIEIKKRLLDKQLKQVDIAKDMGCTRSFITQLIKGNVSNKRFNKWLIENLDIEL